MIGRFLTSLRDGRIEGVRIADGRVLVPPTEYDPVTSDPVGDFVEVGPAGTVQSWTWVEEPRPDKHVLEHPFAFAMIRPDGADTAWVHVVDAGTQGRDGAPACASRRAGAPSASAACATSRPGCRSPTATQPQPAPPRTDVADDEGAVTGMISPFRLEYEVAAGEAAHALSRRA